MAAALTIVVTVAFYFILSALNTANIIPSTISVATSFAAAYLTFRRTPWFSLLYAANDVVLIVLWVLATLEDISYVSVIVCFAMFLVNDLYSFINWRKLRARRKKVKAERFCSAFLLLQQIDFSVRAPCALSLRFPCGSLRKVSFHSREMTERA